MIQLRLFCCVYCYYLVCLQHVLFPTLDIPSGKESPEPAFTYSESTMETAGKRLESKHHNYVNVALVFGFKQVSCIILVFLLLTLNT